MKDSFTEERIDILKKAEELKKVLEIGEDALRPQLNRVERIIEKLKEDRAEISIIGQFKRGKSKVSNRILGEDVMPVGIVPLTSVVTKAVYGESRAEINFMNGESRRVDFSGLEEFISEQRNPGNQLSVKDVSIRIESDFLKQGITFVDTPGVGSFHRGNTEAAYEYIKESDGVIFLLSVDSPINEIEMNLLGRAEAFAGKFYFAVNKIDIVSEAELDEYLSYCRGILSSLLGGEEIRLFPVSANTGEGIDELKLAIEEDIKTSLKDIMWESARKKLADQAGSALKQLSFYRHAIGLSYEELDEKFKETDAIIEELKEEAKEIDSLFEYRLNELVMKLSSGISRVFGMDYEVETEDNDVSFQEMTKEAFDREVEKMLSSTRESLGRTLLYREENAFTVVRRMEDIYKITRRLRSIKNTLERVKLEE